jgi:hypothetical protein
LQILTKYAIIKNNMTNIPSTGEDLVAATSPERLMEAASELAALALSTANPEKREDLMNTLADRLEDSGVATVDVTVAEEEPDEDQSRAYETRTRQQRRRRQELIDGVPTIRRSGSLTVDIVVRGMERQRRLRGAAKS